MSGKNLVTNHDGLGTDMRSTSDAPVTLTAEELEEIERLGAFLYTRAPDF